MFEKVNPQHVDKICDRIGGAIVDLGYAKEERPKIAGECLLGHGNCHIIIETSVNYEKGEIEDIVHRIAGNDVRVDLKIVPQDKHLSDNQSVDIKCGDNGIFKGVKVSEEEKKLTSIVKTLYDKYPYDGKFIYDEDTDTLIACQSNVDSNELLKDLHLTGIKNIKVNPLGDWTGGIDVDTGACNRKLGSDMGRAVTGGGLHFKDISKADVAINVFLHMITNRGMFRRCSPEGICLCAIGDDKVTLKSKYKTEFGEGYRETEFTYKEITDMALEYIKELGGFEKMAEWGLIR